MLHFIAAYLWGQGLFCGIQQQDKRQRVKTRTREVQYKRVRELPYFAGNSTEMNCPEGL